MILLMLSLLAADALVVQRPTPLLASSDAKAVVVRRLPLGTSCSPLAATEGAYVNVACGASRGFVAKEHLGATATDARALAKNEGISLRERLTLLQEQLALRPQDVPAGVYSDLLFDATFAELTCRRAFGSDTGPQIASVECDKLDDWNCVSALARQLTGAEALWATGRARGDDYVLVAVTRASRLVRFGGRLHRKGKQHAFAAEWTGEARVQSPSELLALGETDYYRPQTCYRAYELQPLEPTALSDTESCTVALQECRDVATTRYSYCREKCIGTCASCASPCNLMSGSNCVESCNDSRFHCIAACGSELITANKACRVGYRECRPELKARWKNTCRAACPAAFGACMKRCEGNEQSADLCESGCLDPVPEECREDCAAAF